MATADVGNGVAYVAADRVDARLSLWPASRYITEVFDGADEALAALDAVQGSLVSSGFQTLDWLTAFYEEIAPAQRAMPRLVVVTERSSGDVALVLPLLIQKKRGQTVARFANLGVAAYGGPILGPACPVRRSAIRRVWRSAMRAMRDVDLLRLDHMTAEIGGAPNPLMACRGIANARSTANLLIIPEGVDAYLNGLGKKYRKDVERCYRLWEKQGAPRFIRAETPEQAAHIYAVLEEQLSPRQGATGNKRAFDEPSYRAFCERLAIDGSEAGLASLFALEADGEIAATLFGIVHDDTFTMLHLGTGTAWSHLSPGRLVMIEAMKYFIARGVRRFDLGPGDHPFKHGFGVKRVPLYDLIVARNLAASPYAMYHRLSARLPKPLRLKDAYRLLKSRFSR
ncbi:MAG: GNAT family N-acetyltransferase [Hyphomicrobium denitrificans]|nr:GNAT family N-acetyltransferase [Hyphomicrobium denitrificans]